MSILARLFCISVSRISPRFEFHSLTTAIFRFRFRRYNNSLRIFFSTTERFASKFDQKLVDAVVTQIYIHILFHIRKFRGLYFS